MKKVKTMLFKRCLPVLLAVAMVFTSAPVQTYAEETETHEDHVHESSEEVTSEQTENEMSSETGTEALTENETEYSTQEEDTEEDISQLQQIQEQMDAILIKYLGTTIMTEEEVKSAVVQMDWDTAVACKEEMDAFLVVDYDVTEEELMTLGERLNTFDYLYTFVDMYITPSTIAEDVGTYEPITGVTVAVTNEAWGGAGEVKGSLSEGVLSVTGTTSTSFAKIQATAQLVITNSGSSKATLSFKWTIDNNNSLIIDGSSVSGTAGAFEKNLDSGSTVTISFKSKSGGGNTSTMTLYDFGLEVPTTAWNVTVGDFSNGTVTADNTAVAAGTTLNVAEASGITLVANAASGYTFLGWIDTSNKLLSTSASYKLMPTAAMTVCPVFVNSISDAWFRVGSSYLFDNLNDAIDQAELGSDKIIILANDGILPADEYEIPSGVTLLIPFNDADTCYTTKPEGIDGTFTTPYAYRTLTMASGASLTVKGSMSVSAQIFAAGGSERAAGAPYQTYGYVTMDEGSSITVSNGGALYVYGYITGAGTVLAKSGATIYECFQIEDFRGGSATTAMTDLEHGVFPLSQYYVQNIEVLLTLEAGATEYSYTCLTMSSTVIPAAIAFISNSDAMFTLTEGTVTKRYDKATDRLMITADGTMTINPVELSMKALGGLIGFDIDSADYVLPINSNITVQIDSGSIDLNQDIALLPGAEIIIGKDVTCTLNSDRCIYVYDSEQWGNYCKSAKLYPVYYVPDREYTRSESDLVDARIVVKGTMNAADGYIYTTSSGAAIVGEEEGIAKINPGTATTTYQVTQSGNTVTEVEIGITSAQLMNADGEYTLTDSGNGYDNTYIYHGNGVWVACNNYNVVIDEAVDATCTADGKDEGSHCSTCGTVIDVQESVSAQGHSMSKKEAKAESCTEAGNKEYYTCANCGKLFTDEAGKEEVTEDDVTLPATGHSLSKVDAKDASCTEKGNKQYYSCVNCGKLFTDEAGKEEVTEDDVTLSATGHSLSKVDAKDASCTEKGNKQYYSCVNCGKLFTDEAGKEEVTEDDVTLPASGHSLSKVDAKDASCTEKGNKQYYSCANCGKLFTDEAGKEEVAKDDVTLPATGHSPNKVDAKDANCTEEGNKEYYSCANCGKLFMDEAGKEETTEDDVTLPATGHSLSKVDAKDASCTEKGNKEYYSCANCGKLFTDEAGKEEVAKDDVTLPATGHTLSKVDAVEASCTETGNNEYYVCSICEKMYKDAAGKVETSLEDETLPVLGHDLVPAEIIKEATCTEEGIASGFKCTRCTYTEGGTTIPALGHSYKDKVTKEATCTTDGVMTYTCSICNDTYDEPIIASHILSKVAAKNASCTEEGNKEYYSCANCGKLFTDEAGKEEVTEDDVTLPATGHSLSKVAAKDASCTEEGNKEYYSCANCGKLFTDEAGKEEVAKDDVTLPATGHSPNKVDAKDASCTEAGNKEYYICANCGKLFTDEAGKEEVAKDDVTLPATGHSPNKVDAKDASCTEAGNKKYYICANCGKLFTDEAGKEEVTEDDVTLPASGHSLSKVDAKGASCTEAGNKEYYSCANCGKLFTDEAGKEEVAKDDVTLPATGHSPNKVDAKDANCTEEGNKEYYSCANCGKLFTDEAGKEEVAKDDVTLPASGHSPNKVDAKDASCTEEGNKEYYSCANCGKLFADEAGKEETTEKEVTLEASGHSLSKVEAKAASCTEEGNKEYYTCANCGKFFMDEAGKEETTEDDVTVKATGHNLTRVAAKAATCTEDGNTRYYSCSGCEKMFADAAGKNETTKENVTIPASHSLTKVEAKIPTYASDGNNEYYICSNCGEAFKDAEGITATTVEDETIPVLEKPVITEYDTFIENLALLEEIAETYIEENPSKDPLALIIKYIRTGVDRYNSSSWGIMAGTEDTDFAAYVQEMENMINSMASSQDDLIAVTSLKDIENFYAPNGDYVDFGHMFGTMDISYHNKSSVNHADVAGWAGDLVDLLSTADRHGVTGTLDEMIVDISENYLCKDLDEGDIFSLKDMYGDLDGFYVMQQLYSQDYKNGTLSSIIINYFTEELIDEARAEYFLKNRLDGVTSRDGIRQAVYNAYTGNKVVATLEGTREFTASDSTLFDMRKACCYSFADYLCRLAGDYVEIDGNNYYEVFATESSTLAPGITQEIKKATAADGKQMVYYIATADVKSEYVHVYANYKDNDPSLGWGMQRVLDQANAAQANHSDPESENYIPNYSVITGINADGYNMTTGEPGGLLVMNGIEYHAVDSDGFFGILEDGTAMIGTKADYEIYKDQIQEAVGGFGTTLIKDGKITITATSDYYNNRASRTAVGITKTGKVVFMVLDGRQEPVSCGGSMQEIAQIMLEAGCVQAINLDGGGSTTYVAKLEGADELTVVNNPSDGFARSVSTSLMMVSTAPSSTEFHHAVLSADSAYLTVGSSVQITADGVSAMSNAVEIPEGTTWAVADAEYGTITEDGVFTGLKLGDVDVNLMLEEEVVGTITMHVVSPDAIYFTKESMNATYGETLTLSVEALYERKPVIINENDVVFTLSNETAGVIDGFNFTGNEESGLKQVTVIAALTAKSNVTAVATIYLYRQGEVSFDFDGATGGDRMLAWERQVLNATTEDERIYMVEDTEKPMTTSYTFAIDMTQIPIPEELEELTYMLPGADVEGASAWTFLLQLAERVSVLTEVKPVIKIDPNFDVEDYTEIKVINEYFELTGIELNEETNELTLTLNWKDQTQAIDPDTANPICIVNGIKLTPKEDAAWTESKLEVINSGSISYKVYLRANALYSFAQKQENQETFNLYPFVNPNDENEKGAYFGDVYKEFSDTYTLVNSLKNGWIFEDTGWAYYVEGEKYIGVQLVDGYYYDFGENGINIGRNRYTGMFEKDGKNCYAKAGVLSSGWVTISGNSYCFDENGVGYDGKVILDEVELEFENGLLTGGYTGFVKKADGNTYHYVDGKMTYGWYYVGDDLYHFNTETGVMTTGTHVIPDDEARAKGAYYDFSDDGKTLRGYFNPSGYYYWAGLPLRDGWVKNGADPDPEAWYHTNGNGHYVTDPSGKATFTLEKDGVTYTAVKIQVESGDVGKVTYTFDNSNGKLLEGDVVNVNGTLYYYWAGEAVNDGWFEHEGNTYYAFEDCHLARSGVFNIDGKDYTFNREGMLVAEETDKPVEPDDSDNSIETVPMYRLYNPNTGEHFYTGSEEERDNLAAVGWNYEGVAWNAPVYVGDPVYRVYNPISGDHHYTMSQEEVDNLVAIGWQYEGVAWNCAPVTEDAVPQFRMYNPNAACGSHHYTSSEEERDYLVSVGWIYEGIGWYGTLK